MSESVTDLNERLHAAVSEALRDEGSMMLTRAVVLAEVIEEDGSTALFVGCTPGTQAWQSLGMLRYAASLEDAATTADRVGDR